MNGALCRLLGYNSGETVGKPAAELAWGEDRGRLAEMLEQAGEEAPPPVREVRLMRRDGELLWFEAAASRPPAGACILLHLHDVTARKDAERRKRDLAELAIRQEEQLEHSTRLAELGEMAAAISHELNQPLTGIRNFARNAFYMLEKHVGSEEEVKGNLRLISDQVDRASKIINQMRAMTRRSDRQFVRLDLNGILRESVEFLLPQLKMAKIEARLDLAPDLPEIQGERIRLTQVFLNLIANAQQAMEGGPERHLTIRSFSDGECEGSQVVVEIADTGKGFSPVEARKLFVPFYTTKKSGRGTGLGLSISKSIILDHGGAIEARGEPQKGATFRILLPVLDEEPRP